MKPTIGRIVHYNHPIGPVAAIVTDVLEDGRCTLMLFRSGGFTEARVAVGEGDKNGDWSWPPRVEGT